MKKLITENITAYLQACKEGSAEVFNALLLVVGSSGDGKTSLIKRLMGENINPTHVITNALDSDICCKINITKVSQAWSKISKDKSDTIASDVTAGLTDEVHIDSVLAKSDQGNMEGFASKTNSALQIKEGGDLSHLNLVDREDAEKLPAAVKPRTLPALSEDKKIESEIKKMMLKTMKTTRSLQKGGKEKDRSVIYVWDFGGQLVYSSIHQVFHRSHCVYILVVNLSRQLEEKIPLSQAHSTTQATDLARGDAKNSSSANTITYGEQIEIWINLILSRIRKHDQAKGKGEVILVGTHKDLLHEDREEQEKLAKLYFNKLKEKLRNKQYKHLIRRYVAIDSKGGDPEVYGSLRTEIMQAIKIHCNWGKRRPIKWLLLEKKLHELQNDNRIPETDRNLVRLQDIMKYATDYKMESEEDVKAFLEFSHLSGDLTYFSTPELKDYVIPNPQWLVNVFRSIITLQEFYPDDSEVEESLDKLRNEGLIDRKSKLLHVLWGDFLISADQKTKQTLIDFLLNLMIEFDLLVPHSDRICFVPSLLPLSSCSSLSLFPKMIHSAPALYFRFHASRDSHNSFLDGSTMYDEFLPHGLFQQLICRCVKVGLLIITHDKIIINNKVIINKIYNRWPCKVHVRSM